MLAYVTVFQKEIPMYGVMIVLGMFFASVFMVYDCKRRALLWEDAVIIGATGFGFGMIGAKLLYIFVSFTPYELFDIVKNGKSELIMSGGFVFYGGLIAGILGALTGACIAKVKLCRYENILIKAVPFVHAFGRIGCLCAGCCYGKPTDGAFYVVFENPVSDAPRGVHLMPIQLYEAGFDMLLFAFLIFFEHKYPKTRILLPIYLIAYSAERFIAEFFRYDAIRGSFGIFSTSQWISIGLFIFGTALATHRLKRKRA